jgi:hypothetical protein
VGANIIQLAVRDKVDGLAFVVFTISLKMECPFSRITPKVLRTSKKEIRLSRT